MCRGPAGCCQRSIAGDFSPRPPLADRAIYSFLTPAPCDVKWQFRPMPGFVFMERDISDDTFRFGGRMSPFLALDQACGGDDHRHFGVGSHAYFMATRSEKTRDLWLF